MKSITIAQPFVSLVESKTEEFPWMMGTYQKVRKVVWLYATHRTLSLSNITLGDVMDDRGALHPDLEKFINKLTRPSGRTPERHKDYKEEAKARIRRIVATLFEGITPRSNRAGELGGEPIPEFMLPVLDVMSRVGGWRLQGGDAESVRLARRHLPLNEEDRLVLPCILRIVRKYELTTYEPVFTEHRLEAYQLVRDTYPESKWQGLCTRLIWLRRRLGLRAEAKRTRLELSEFPPTLRKQCEVYVKNAGVGLEEAAPQLADLARGEKIVVKKAAVGTIRDTIRSIGTALSRMPSLAGRDVDVEDLLRLTPLERQVRGRALSFLGNPYIEELRAYERSLVTKRKRRGLDSSRFQDFLAAFKTVAAYNGIFEYHEPFNAAYKVRLDDETREAITLDKKETFDLGWVDGEIARLGVEFRRICRDGSFKYGSLREDGTARTTREVRKVMRLCLFYVALVTLRYMGYRQQCLRSCVLDVHITFTGRTIHFSWKPDEIKNKKALTGALTRGKDDRLYKPFLDALWDYHKYIYPYVQATSGEAIGGNFFVHHTHDGSCLPFRFDDARNFYMFFVQGAREFLIFDGRLAAGARSLNPHFFRGLACDWLKDEGASNEGIADYVGDHVRTVERKYLKKKTKHDIRRAINEADDSHFAKDRREHEPALVRELVAQLKSKGLEVAHANSKAAEQAISYESRIGRLEVQLSVEREQRAREHEELMRALALLNSDRGPRSNGGNRADTPRPTRKGR